MPTNPTYTKVYDWILSLGLSASEALVYAYILRRVERRKHCDFQLSELTSALNLSDRGLRNILDRLCAAGLIQTTRLQRGIVINVLSSAESAEQERQKVPDTVRQKVLKKKVPDSSAESAEQERQKVPMTPYIETDIETGREGARARVEAPVSVPYVAAPPQPQVPSVATESQLPPQPAHKKNSLLSDSDLHRLHTAIMQGWQQHYRDTFGTEYLLTRGSVTAEVADLAPAILSLLQAYKQPASAAAEFSARLFNSLHSVADNWQLQNWNLRIVRNQFNDLLKRLNNGNTAHTSPHASAAGQLGYSADELADVIANLYAE